MRKVLFTVSLLGFFSGLFAQIHLNRVVAAASIFAGMAENIAGGHCEIKTIIPIGGDPHIYSPAPGDA